MKRVSPAVLAAILAAIVIAAVGLRTGPSKLWQEREVLRQVYTPKFEPIPEMLSAKDLVLGLRDNLRSDRGQSFLRSWVPNQGGALWLSLLVMLAIGFNFKRPGDPRNVALVAMQALGFLFFDILRFLDLLHDRYAVTLMDWVFCGIVFVNVLLMGLAVWHVVRPQSAVWRPSLPVPALLSVAVLLVAIDLFAAAVRPPDDAGFFVNLGGQRLRERGLLPYGDPILTGTPAAGYGPLLYAAHVPFQLVFDPAPANPVSSPSPPLGADSTYVLPPSAATKLCTIAFHLLGLVALYRIGHAHAGPEVGWALVALYAGSACVLGVGGEAYFIGGMTFVSHIAPAAVTLAAFAALDRPAGAAVLLTAAAGVGFYPAFLAPAWLGFYWDRPAARRRFLAMLAISGAVLALAVLVLSRPAAGRGAHRDDSLGHLRPSHRSRGVRVQPVQFLGTARRDPRLADGPARGDVGAHDARLPRLRGVRVRLFRARATPFRAGAGVVDRRGRHRRESAEDSSDRHVRRLVLPVSAHRIPDGGLLLGRGVRNRQSQGQALGRHAAPQELSDLAAA